MTPLAPLLQAFFTERLAKERQASPHTVSAYKTTFSLLLRFARDQLATAPSDIRLDELSAPLISSFLQHLEAERGNCVRTRNARLAAIHSFFRYIAVLVPDHADQVRRVLDIPHKRFDRRLVDFLTRPELEALLAAPDRTTWIGRRDHALVLLAIQTGPWRPWGSGGGAGLPAARAWRQSPTAPGGADLAPVFLPHRAVRAWRSPARLGASSSGLAPRLRAPVRHGVLPAWHALPYWRPRLYRALPAWRTLGRLGPPAWRPSRLPRPPVLPRLPYPTAFSSKS